MTPIVYVVGHSPPPVTGENLCRKQLIDTLRDLHYKPVPRARGALGNVFIARASIWILSGAKPHGHLRDLLMIIWWLLRQNFVTVYVHNVSWRYFKRLAFFWRIWRRLRFVVLTDPIAEQLSMAGLLTERLDNTLSDRSENPSPGRQFIPRLLWMGAITSEKGFRIAYEVFAELKSTDNRWRFDVYGAGALASATDFQLAHFHGFASGEVKEAAFRQGGVFILPSRYPNETQPLAIIEALHYAVPVVSSDIGGLPAMLIAGEERAGLSLPADASLHEWVRSVLAVAADYEKMSSAASVVYQKRFSQLAYREALRSLMNSYDRQ